jgi:hypothetical protein
LGPIPDVEGRPAQRLESAQSRLRTIRGTIAMVRKLSL